MGTGARLRVAAPEPESRWRDDGSVGGNHYRLPTRHLQPAWLSRAGDEPSRSLKFHNHKEGPF